VTYSRLRRSARSPRSSVRARQAFPPAADMLTPLSAAHTRPSAKRGTDVSAFYMRTTILPTA
jgi:hypothetical protein